MNLPNLKRMFSVKVVITMVVGVLLFWAGSVAQVIFGYPFPDESELTPERTAKLAEARAVAAALILYAIRHEGKWPPTLEALKPELLGTNIDVSGFRFHHPDGRWEGAQDWRTVAAEKEPFTSGQIVCIYANGIASMHRLGD